MAKYLIQASYSVEGAKGLKKEGAVARKAAVEKMVGNIGGRLEAFYFAFGDADVYAIADLPDNVTAAAFSFAVNSTGAVQLRTIVLISAEEMDQAIKKQVNYRQPGQ